MSPGYWYLLGAIVAEVVGTLCLKASQELTRSFPATMSILAYIVSFYLLAMVFRTVPVGIAYAVWSGVGIVFITIFSTLIFGQRPDVPAIVGMTLILAGVVVINLFSKSVPH